MNGRIARELRRVCNFSPKENREYITHNVGQKEGTVLRFDPVTKEIGTTNTMIDCYVTECVSPERKMYKEIKRKYKEFVETGTVNSSFTTMPSDEQIEGLIKEIKENENDSTD